MPRPVEALDTTLMKPFEKQKVAAAIKLGIG
jgi:hypothetical protein